MHVVSIVGQKGGTGKTTLTQCLSVEAARAGQSVMVLDLDPQANTANWYDRRADKERPMVTTAPVGRLKAAVDAAAAAGVDLLIIDTAGKLEGPALVAVELAGLAIIPCRPQIKDLETLPAVWNLLRSVGGRPALVVLSDVPIAGKRHEEAADYIAGLGFALPVCPARLSHRVAFADADVMGLAAQEYDPGGKAAEEIKLVYKYTSKLLKEVKPYDQTHTSQRAAQR